jgi:hypothetical protein
MWKSEEPGKGSVLIPLLLLLLPNFRENLSL